MYIRRKVYSAVEDYDGEIRYFSTNEIISEEDYLEALYSEDYLDDDDMERLFAEKEGDKKKGLSTGAKIAIGAGTAAVAVPAALVAASKGKKAITYKQMLKKARMGDEAIEQAVAKLKGSEKSKMRRRLQKEAQNARKAIAEGYEGKGIGFVESALDKGKAKYSEARKAADDAYKKWKINHPSKKELKERVGKYADELAKRG